ncbi:MAG: hypothetical protein ACRCZI_13435, partial [Cetobacterium sp.]
MTGGGINPDKSFWYLLDYRWNPATGKWLYLTKMEAPAVVSIREPNSEVRVELQRLEPHEARMTLGVEVAMDGNQEREMEHLREKAERFADNYRTAKGLEKNEAWDGILTTVMATMRYPAAATQLTEKQWDYVLAPIFQSGLPKAGITRMFPKSVLYGPMLFQGLDVMHMFDYQELEHLKILLQHGNKDTKLTELLKHSWEALRLELGLPGALTDWNYALLGECATECWLKTLWKYCRDNEIGILDEEAKLELKRAGDRFLMEAFVNARFDAKQLKLLNEVRNWLKAVTLADVVTADGRTFLPGIKRGERSSQQLHNYSWPRQPDRLTKAHWDIWEEALNKCFGGHLEPDRLLHPLGMWKTAAKGQWEWMVSIGSATLFKKIPNGWQPHCITRGGVRPGSIFKKQGRRVNTLPPGSRPTDISTTGLRRDQIRVNTYSTDGCETEAREEHLTLQALLDALPEHSKWAVEEMKQFGNCEDEGKDVAEAIVLGKCRAVTDGTHKLQEGAASFAVHGNTSRRQLMGSNRTPGRRDEITPYRAELGGVVGILVLLTVLCQLHHITAGKVELG